jgi:hypothetical protein
VQQLQLVQQNGFVRFSAATLALRHSYSVLPTNGIGIWFFYPQRGVVMIFWTKRLTSKEKFLINHTM